MLWWMEKNVFDQPVKNNKITYENRKIAISQGYDYAVGCLLDCSYFRDKNKVIAIDLRKKTSARSWS